MSDQTEYMSIINLVNAYAVSNLDKITFDFKTFETTDRIFREAVVDSRFENINVIRHNNTVEFTFKT